LGGIEGVVGEAGIMSTSCCSCQSQHKTVVFLPGGKPGPENIYLAYWRKLFSDPGLLLTKSATTGCYGYCDGADFPECTFRMATLGDNNACNSVGNNPGDSHGYNTDDTVHNYRDFPRSAHSIHGCPGVHHYHSVPHQPMQRYMAPRGS